MAVNGYTRAELRHKLFDELEQAWTRNSHLSLASFVKILSLHTDDSDEELLAALEKSNKGQWRYT